MSLYKEAKDLYQHYLRLYGGLIGIGSWRSVFDVGGGKVHKLPFGQSVKEDSDIVENGLQNMREWEIYSTGNFVGGHDNIKWILFQKWFSEQNLPLPLAECRLFHVGRIPVLEMEHVKSLDECEIRDLTGDPWLSFRWVRDYFEAKKFDKPYWIHLVDGGQVGYNDKNELVVYDYNFWV